MLFWSDMAKPLLYAYDCKDEPYQDITDIFDVVARPILPSISTLESYAALVLHTTIVDPQERKRFFREAKRRNLPVFVVPCNENVMNQFRGAIEDESLDYDNVHWVNTYPRMAEKIREIFME